MNPFVLLAGSVLPDILKLAVGSKGAPLVESVARAVERATGTEDPGQAETIIRDDPKVAAELRVELARIAAQEEASRRRSEIDELRLLIGREDDTRTATRNQAKAADDDQEDARRMLLALAGPRNPLAWVPAIISIIITFGFFWILWTLLQPAPAGQISALDPSSPVVQALNIVIGGLVSAFATVVSYFLGSSAGSRAKDTTAIEFQGQLAQQTRETVRAQTQQANSVLAAAKEVPRPGASVTPSPEAGAARFEACLEVVFAKEGGFSDNANDKGGPTSLGIAIDTLRAWRGTAVTEADVRDLTRQEARDIYRSMYWNVLKCDQLPSGVDLVVFDHGVNAGPGGSAKMLQKIVGTAIDGSIGPVTLDAARRRDPSELIRRFTQSRLEYYRGRDDAEQFQKGWANRAQAVEQVALGMVDTRKAA